MYANRVQAEAKLMFSVFFFTQCCDPLTPLLYLYYLSCTFRGCSWTHLAFFPMQTCTRQHHWPLPHMFFQHQLLKMCFKSLPSTVLLCEQHVTVQLCYKFSKPLRISAQICAQESTSDLLKHSCGIVVLGCFAASGLGQLPIIDRFCAITEKSTGTFQGVSLTEP